MRNIALKKLLLKWIEVDKGEELDRYRIEYRGLVKPNRFLGKESFEIIYIKEFEETCHILQGFTKRNIKEMNIVEYYTLIDYAEKKIKESKGLSLLNLMGIG
ncbi:MAG: hypothetical protein EOL88_02275 [Bacteroidia bacterium]|nr:hypothetical protein [Bacteroidia bacterium]